METKLNQYTYSDIFNLIKRNTIGHPKMANCKTSTPSWYGALTTVDKDGCSIQFGFSYPFEEPMMKILSAEYEFGMFYIDHETECLKFLSSNKKYQKLLPEEKPIRLDKRIDIKFNETVDSMITKLLVGGNT